MFTIAVFRRIRYFNHFRHNVLGSPKQRITGLFSYFELNLDSHSKLGISNMGSIQSVDNCEHFKINSSLTERLKDSFVHKNNVCNDLKINCENMKPPNVLIAVSEEEKLKFQIIKRSITDLIGIERFTFHHAYCKTLAQDIWIDNTELLLVVGDIPFNVFDNISKFIKNGGKVISYSHDLNRDILNYIPCNVYSFALKKSSDENTILDNFNEALSSKMEYSQHLVNYQERNVRFLSCHQKLAQTCTILYEEACDDEPKLCDESYCFQELCVNLKSFILSHLFKMKISVESKVIGFSTSVFLFSQNSENKTLFIDDLRSKKTWVSGIPLHLNSDNVEEKIFNLIDSDDFQDKVPKLFNKELFFYHLSTKHVGKLVLYSDVITSTMDFSSTFQKYHGLTVIALKQTNGKGRNGNDWLSPDGCAMFSVSLSFPISSSIGSNISFIQLIASLAVVEAVLNLSGYEELPITLKWPNDIYYKDKVKLGGVLVKASIMKNTTYCNIGIGVNLNNESPTICINEIIRSYNELKSSELEGFSHEVFIAKVLNKLEELILQYEQFGVLTVLNKYYKRWLHGNAEVTISSTVKGFVTEEKVQVYGVDKFGFLKIKRENNEIVSVQPDGNSFDLMKNLIFMKPQ